MNPGESQTPPQPLQGLLVVSLEQAVAAPYCASRLADAGARVIKIERSDGDFARHYDGLVNGESAYFVWLNRGKESLCLDIKNAEDAALLDRMLMQADVFIQNLAPGAAARSGFDSEALRARNQKLITVDISGYGDAAQYQHMKAYDLLVQCETGLAAITGAPSEPGRVGVSACDIACGMYAHTAVLQALLERAQTGVGKGLSVSLFSALADWMTVPLLQHEGGMTPHRAGLNHPTIAPYGAYTCGDGSQIVFCVQNEREWQRFCASVLLEASSVSDGRDIASDVRFADNAARIANRSALDEMISGVLDKLTREQVIARLNQANMAYGAVNQVADLATHPALQRVPQETPSGTASVVAPPVQESNRPWQMRPVPALGAHSAALRAEFAEAGDSSG